MARVPRLVPVLSRRPAAILLAFALLFGPAGLSAGGAPAAGQAPSPTPFDGRPAAGRVLVAADKLQDPYFRHTVVLLLEHDGQGTLGMIINRPTTLSLSSLSEKFLRAGDVDLLYYGGPVQPMSFSMLVATETAGAGQRPVLQNLYHVFGAHRIMTAIAQLEPHAAVRIYSGYAGWAPGQLEHEIRLGGWRVLPGESAQVFSDTPEQLWDELSRLLQGHWL